MREPYRMPGEPTALGEIASVIDRQKPPNESPPSTRPCADCGVPVQVDLYRDWVRGRTQVGQRCDRCQNMADARRIEEARLAPIPTAFHWARFASPELSQRAPAAAIEKARASVLLPRVVLVGQAGTGKTSLGCAMIRDRLDARQNVAVALAWRIGGARSRHPLGQDDAPDVERAITAGLLLLDDMGSERNIPSNAVPDVVFERHAEGRPTWVTTWMTPEQMAERYGDGIARRVFEGAVVIDCGKERTEAAR